MSKYLDLATTLITTGLLITAIYGFYDNHQIVRTQTSMDFCTFIYPILQSEEFVEREQYLIATLSSMKETHQPCAFDELENPKLRYEIRRYCECLNDIGVLLQEHMINEDVIVPYIGTNTTILYELIRPYLDLTRDKFHNTEYGFFNAADNEKIQNAAALYFVHYELLALKMREEGPALTKELRNKLSNERKKNKID